MLTTTIHHRIALASLTIALLTSITIYANNQTGHSNVISVIAEQINQTVENDGISTKGITPNQPRKPLPVFPPPAAGRIHQQAPQETRTVANLKQTAPPPPTVPNIIGSLKADNGVTLSKMIARIYGHYTNKRLNLVVKANPHITNANRIKPGTIIHFPRPATAIFTPPKHSTWVEIARENTLASAYTFVKEYPESLPPLLIVPLASANSLQFMIVLEQFFKNQEEAEKTTMGMAQEYQRFAKIRQGQEFYSRGLKKPEPQSI